ncbi:hypothetical protein DACRYDRAFT_20780 [Dacryopinax primogenitus]|uniref:Transcription factor IIA, alpha/beta subunit n=1 Tax=Dacryopinax primogenitus (strain DJM 731) TaxID=1858805 RepID=M5G609_DACPD|nr:uncharacterized protein DACRYDRAFT_20780 [Dacryopinax primogenitus]EJU04154.1 hypothetical protein DACRYDRAFT_20780 [Dacryopinax primogenitus]
MSNRIVPATYRNIIDEVIASIKTDFEDAGVENDVIQELQNRWEMKVVASRVAQFEPAPPSPPQRLPPLPPPPPPGYIKTEPNDNFALYGASSNIPNRPPGAQQPRLPYPATNGNGALVTPNGNHPSQHSDDSDSDEATAHHPTPQKPTAKPPKPPKAKPLPTNDEEIGSDLDDSDDEELGEEEEGDDGGRDSVLCTYDKVQRVKNKWKCVLKDGIMHINGKDYLFSKCTGEFDW